MNRQPANYKVGLTDRGQFKKIKGKKNNKSTHLALSGINPLRKT